MHQIPKHCPTLVIEEGSDDTLPQIVEWQAEEWDWREEGVLVFGPLVGQSEVKEVAVEDYADDDLVVGKGDSSKLESGYLSGQLSTF